MPLSKTLSHVSTNTTVRHTYPKVMTPYQVVYTVLPTQVHSGQVANLIVRPNILVFAGPTVSVAATQLYPYGLKQPETV